MVDGLPDEAVADLVKHAAREGIKTMNRVLGLIDDPVVKASLMITAIETLHAAMRASITAQAGPAAAADLFRSMDDARTSTL